MVDAKLLHANHQTIADLTKDLTTKEVYADLMMSASSARLKL
jgi:hypothetical protein